jgi:hypothetical protein
VAKRLGYFMQRGLVGGLKKGSSSSRLLSFSGNWPKLNPLYKLRYQLSHSNQPLKRFGGRLNDHTPFAYVYDMKTLSVAAGVFEG